MANAMVSQIKLTAPSGVLSRGVLPARLIAIATARGVFSDGGEAMATRLTDDEIKSLVGFRFGMLTIESFAGRKGVRIMYECRCDCGGTITTKRCRLITGGVNSCGCSMAENKKTHGYAYRAEYRTWQGMLNRCRWKGDPNYHRYGGRGIRVCKRWLKFENFIAGMGERPSVNHSIDRIDNDGNYEPSNCRWATMKEQGRNRSDNVNITYKGETKCISEWAEDRGMVMNTLRLRLQRGWSVERAIETTV